MCRLLLVLSCVVVAIKRSVSLCVYTLLVAERFEMWSNIQFIPPLGDNKQKLFKKYNGLLGTMLLVLRKLRSAIIARCQQIMPTSSGRPSTSGNDKVLNKVRSLLKDDHCIIVGELPNDVRICMGSVHLILTRFKYGYKKSVKNRQRTCTLSKVSFWAKRSIFLK